MRSIRLVLDTSRARMPLASYSRACTHIGTQTLVLHVRSFCQLALANTHMHTLPEPTPERERVCGESAAGPDAIRWPMLSNTCCATGPVIMSFQVESHRAVAQSISKSPLVTLSPSTISQNSLKKRYHFTYILAVSWQCSVDAAAYYSDCGILEYIYYSVLAVLLQHTITYYSKLQQILVYILQCAGS